MCVCVCVCVCVAHEYIQKLNINGTGGENGTPYCAPHGAGAQPFAGSDADAVEMTEQVMDFALVCGGMQR